MFVLKRILAPLGFLVLLLLIADFPNMVGAPRNPILKFATTLGVVACLWGAARMARGKPLWGDKQADE